VDIRVNRSVDVEARSVRAAARPKASGPVPTMENTPAMTMSPLAWTAIV
jgi:hypothetical protein